MSKTILNKLKKSFTELNKIILNEYLIDITKNNIKYQITITKKLLDINMNDDEFIEKNLIMKKEDNKMCL